MSKKISTLGHIPKQIPTLNQYIQKIFHIRKYAYAKLFLSWDKPFWPKV